MMCGSKDNTFRGGQRIEYIDYLRCFGIIIMIMGHIGFSGIFDKWIHSFHMPLWFFISGYFCSKSQPIGNHIYKRLRTILVPYVLFALIYIVIYGIMSNDWQWMGIVYPNSRQVPLNGALWFLLALFLSDTIAYIILKVLPEKVAIACMLTIGIIGSLSTTKLPFALDSALVGIGFYVLGYVFRYYCKSLSKLSIWKSSLLVIVCSILALLNTNINMRANKYGCIIYFWIIAVGMIIGLWNFFRCVTKKNILKPCLEIGSESILYVCLNQFIIYWLAQIRFENIIIESLWKLMIVAIVILICFLVNRGMKKTFLKAIIGR